MSNKLCTILLCLTAIIMVSCKGLKMESALRGIKCGDDKITLDGDTFVIYAAVGDSFLIVSTYQEEDAKCYLIKLESNGFYYAQKKADDISTIENTSELVSIDNAKIYDVAKRTEFPLPCDMTYLSYLGEWKGLTVFTNQDSICFSDGKCIALQGDTYCEDDVPNKGVKLVKGARELIVSYEALRKFQYHTPAVDNTVARLTNNYYVKPLYEGEYENIGFSVDLDVPKGNTNADNAIREWMLTAIKDDSFSLLGYEDDIPSSSNPSYQEMMTTLDRYGDLWEKLCRQEYQGDTIYMRLNAMIEVRKVVDCNDYTTYYYYANLDGGGIHGMPRSYYITYDKKRNVQVTAANTIKHGLMKKFRTDVLKSLKVRFDKNYEEEETWDNFTQYVFSFHQPIIDTDSMDDVEKSLLIHQYTCDEWSEWGDVEAEEFTIDNFPLPHFAVLPEGIVVTYHPYQIDGFMNGEYHVLIPFDKISSYLQYDYHELPALYPRLEQFVKLNKIHNDSFCRI